MCCWMMRAFVLALLLFFSFLYFVGTVVTLFMSRSATYGYDQRCEIFGSKGLVSVNNIHETSTGIVLVVVVVESVL